MGLTQKIMEKIKMKMKANKKISLFLILSVLTLMLAGCPALQEPVEVILKPDQNNVTSKRFQDAAPKGQTAVDSAVELSKKNTELFEQMTELMLDNQELTAENRRLEDRIAVLEPELKQAEKEFKQAKQELNEANDLLIEMRIELNNWKTDILGFRNEIRDADTAQMEILLKVARALGAEIATEQQEKKQSTETSTSGEPNE
jgi:chromosome segregation ATPase